MNSEAGMLGVITVRMASGRLPGKALLPLAGKPILAHVIERIRLSSSFDRVVVATSIDESNDPIEALCEEMAVDCFRGSEDDVLDRHVRLLERYGAKDFVRFCGDNVFTDMETADRLVEAHRAAIADYTCVRQFRLPLGLTEVVSRRALEISHREAEDGVRRESITLYIREHPERFRICTLAPDAFLHQSPYRLTLDYVEDYRLVQAVFDRLYESNPIPYRSVLELLASDDELARLNAQREQKEGNRYWEELDARLPPPCF